MKRSVYRNFYYIKESISEFFSCNKKYLFFGILSIFLGIVVGLLIGLNHVENFTFINCYDKSILNLLCRENALWYLLKQMLAYAFVIFIILLLNMFSYVCYLNYVLFSYLSFRLIIDCIIIVSMLKTTGFLFVIFYFLIKLLIIFLLLIISMACKSANNFSCGNKFSNYPFRAIVFMSIFIFILCLLLMIIGIIFSKFVSIII